MVCIGGLRGGIKNLFAKNILLIGTVLYITLEAYYPFYKSGLLLSHSENAEGYVLIAVYSFIYLYVCYSHNSKSIQPNRMKFGGMISYYPGTI